MGLMQKADKLISETAVILVLTLAGPVTLSKTEQQWAKLLQSDKTTARQVFRIGSGKKSFIGLHQEVRRGRHRGAIILLHDMGQHPDWQYVIKPLRTRLPQHGWTTVSIQLPVLGGKHKAVDYLPVFDEAVNRIQATVQWLHKRRIRNIVIIGHGLGGTIGALYLALDTGNDIKAFVGISIYSTRQHKPLDTSLSLAITRIPVLDIFAENDLEPVLAGLIERQQLKYKYLDNRRSGKRRYRQLEFEGADHSYLGHTERLIKRIRSWLRIFATNRTAGRN